MTIGSCLRQLRIEKGYTLSEVAGRLEMSVSFLSQLENMKLSPSIESLEKLCFFYSVNLSDFFRQVEQRRFIIVPKDKSRTFGISEGAIKLTLLASKLQNNSLESYIVEFTRSSEISTAVLPRDVNGERVIYVINGSVLLSIDSSEAVLLEEGGSVNYKAYVPCSIRSAEGSSARLLVSGMPPLILAVNGTERVEGTYI